MRRGQGRGNKRKKKRKRKGRGDCKDKRTGKTRVMSEKEGN